MSLEGRHLGRYRLLEPIGSGGMSVVYRGLDTSLQREVAVKVLHPHLARQQDARARLAREARAVARLQHPNILEVFDFADPSTEDAFLVTELVRGETLKAFAERSGCFPRSWRRWWSSSWRGRWGMRTRPGSSTGTSSPRT